MTGAGEREQVNRPGGFALTDRALLLCEFPPGARLLDVGCGSGATVRHVRTNHGLEAHGVDLDRDLARGRNHLVCASGERLPFQEGAFDGVMLECSLSVMIDPDQVLQECRRVLARDGRLLISDVYARGTAANLKGCLGRVETLSTMLVRLQRHGFRVDRCEDCSGHLRALWGQKLLEKGAAGLCVELGADRERLKAVNCGYVLLVARKRGP